MNSVSSDMPIGTEFAGYRITRMIGRGGMSCVYAAEHIRLGRPAALKVLSPVRSADEAFRARFVRESQLAATLDHPNIVANLRRGRGRRGAVHRDAACARGRAGIVRSFANRLLGRS